jgi:predicted dehydrogenase
MTVRVGVVGAGFGARVVAPVFAETEGCEVVDVVSARDDAAVAALCARRDLDLVSVHSPPFLHVAHVRAAVEAGHAVLCDKPFGRNEAEATEMLRVADAAGVVHLLNFELRWTPAREQLRELVRAGAVGTPEHVQWTHVSSGSRVPLRPHGWLFQRELGGGWIGAWGSHAVDALRWMFGEITDVRADCRVTIAQRPDPDGVMRPCDAEDAFTATLRAEGGVSVAIDTTFVAPVSLPPRIVVVGSDGVVESVGDTRLALRRADGTREDVEDAPPAGGDRHLVPMRRWAVKVRDAVHEGAAPADTPTFADGLACVRVLDRLREGLPIAP